MHEGVQTWETVCDCEPEPRWQALAEELQREADDGKNTKGTPNKPSSSADHRSPETSPA